MDRHPPGRQLRATAAAIGPEAKILRLPEIRIANIQGFLAHR
jgi:hypothetical protein